jgi:integration host factor subunit beta
MTRSELMAKISTKYPTFTLAEVESVVKCILEGMEEALVTGRRIEVRGFGSFSVKRQRQRQARNPKTGDSVFVEEKCKIHFKPGKELRDRVNNKVA